MSNSLLESYENDRLSLKNRVVMGPMTRSRATAEHVPTDIMKTYYHQRTGAGLILTEGVAPSPNGVGYPRIPGIYNQEQTEAWKPVTAAVKQEGTKFFMQLMHTGRISHPDNMPEGSTVLAPSAVRATETKMYVDGKGEQDLPTPQSMSEKDIENEVQEFVNAAKNAIEAGFDGVEVHGANGYLIEQFINAGTNQRDDEWGGDDAGRSKFAVEVTKKIAEEIGKEKVGIRLSPNGAFNDINAFEGQESTFDYLSKELNDLGILYIHLVNHESFGANPLPEDIRANIRSNFDGILILSGGYGHENAQTDLDADKGDLVAFSRPFIANPDLVERFRKGAELADPDFNTFYTPGEEGYIDYPKLEEA